MFVLYRLQFQRMTLSFLMEQVTSSQLKKDVNRFDFCFCWCHVLPNDLFDTWHSLLLPFRFGQQLKPPHLIMTRRNWRRGVRSFPAESLYWRSVLFEFIRCIHAWNPRVCLSSPISLPNMYYDRGKWDHLSASVSRLEELVKLKGVRRRTEWQMLWMPQRLQLRKAFCLVVVLPFFMPQKSWTSFKQPTMIRKLVHRSYKQLLRFVLHVVFLLDQYGSSSQIQNYTVLSWICGGKGWLVFCR